jgi:2-aminoadipate transaminase
VLRELVCHKYDLFEGLQIGPQNLLIANGSGAALGLAVSAFVDVGDVLICEAPTFHGTLNMIRRHGPEILTAPVDDEGMNTDAVREHLARLKKQGRRCKLIYTITNFQNPAGPTLSRRRREELVALADEYETFILEDDAYGELRFHGEPVPSLYALDTHGRVIRAGTLSKILGAGVRLGWLCAPPELIPVFQSFNFGGGVNPFMSRLAVYYLRDHMPEHVELLCNVYRDKCQAMQRGLWEELAGTDATVSEPEGGFFLWVKLPSGTYRAQVAELAAEAGITYVAGPAFFANGGGEEYIRLAFSYDTPTDCYEGAKLLGKAIRASMP